MVEPSRPTDVERADSGETARTAVADLPSTKDAIHVQSPAFEQLEPSDAMTGSSIDRFYDVTVKVSATLGTVSMSLGELVRLGEGAVVKLDRPVTAPVELVAQGVRVARGEVVVVDDCFAVRITEIESRKS